TPRARWRCRPSGQRRASSSHRSRERRAIHELAHLAPRHEMAHAPDFTPELDAVLVAHLLADRLADSLDVERVGLAHVDEEIRVHLAHLCPPEGEAATTRAVDQLPARMTRWVLERRSGRLRPRRL